MSECASLHIKGRVLARARRRPGTSCGWWTAASPTSGRPRAPDAGPSRAGCCPGWSTRTAMSASDAHGAVDARPAEKQALTDRDAGALLLRDAGSPADTRWIDDREDLPRIIRAGRHIARTTPLHPQLRPGDRARRPGRVRAARGAARRRLGEARRRLDRPRGGRPGPLLAALGALEEAIAAAHEEGARVTAHCFAEDSLRRPGRGRHRLRRARHGADRGHHPALRRARRRHRPHAGQHRHLPAARGGRRGQVPALGATTCGGCTRRRYDTVRAAYDAGIPVFTGTDAGGSLAHGLVAEEVAELVTAGLRSLRRALRRRPGAPARGWAAPASRRAPRPTSSSTTPTRAPTSGAGRAAAGSCCAAGWCAEPRGRGRPGLCFAGCGCVVLRGARVPSHAREVCSPQPPAGRYPQAQGRQARPPCRVRKVEGQVLAPHGNLGACGSRHIRCSPKWRMISQSFGPRAPSDVLRWTAR